MLVTIQFRFTDLRRLQAPSGVEFLHAPSWPDPAERQFVRFFGGIAERKSGGLTTFGENLHCELRRALFCPHRHMVIGGRKLTVSLRQSRLFFDGVALLKIEVALAVKVRHRDKNVIGEETNLLLRTILRQEVRVRRSEGSTKFEDIHLYEAGAKLGKLYCGASISGASEGDFSNGFCVHKPLIHILSDPVENVVPPEPFRNLDDKDARIGLSFYKLNRVFKGDPTVVPVWLQRASPDAPKRDSRQLRLALLRLNSEYETLRHVATAVHSGQVAPSPRSRKSQLLQDYIWRTIRILRKEEARISSDSILQIATANLGIVHPGALDSLVEKLQFGLNIRGNLLKNLRKYLEDNMDKQRSEKDSAKGISIENVQGSQIVINSSANGDISATLNHVKGNTSSPDLRKLLEELGEKISKTAELMEGDDAKQLAQRYRMFADEAISKKPDKTILGSIGTKIVEITSPVVKFASDIAKMIGAIKDLF